MVRFNPILSGGVEKENIVDSTNSGSKSNDTGSDDTCDNDLTKSDRDNAPSLDNIISDYYKKYWYSSKNAGMINQYSDDFMLKTQMIPPVCPACPTCPTNTTCTNCGGNGGAGVVNGVGKAVGGIADGVGKAVGGIAGGVGDIAEGAGGVAGGALLGTGALAGGALMGGGAVVGGVAQGVGSAIGGLGQGQGYNSQVHSGAIGGQGHSGQSLWNPTNVQNISSQGNDQTRIGYYNGQNGQPQNVSTGNNYSSYIDKYSYNGALTTKGGDPMPVTSDFSRFGR